MKLAEQGSHPRSASFSLFLPDETGLLTGHDDQPGAPRAARIQTSIGNKIVRGKSARMFKPIAAVTSHG